MVIEWMDVELVIEWIDVELVMNNDRPRYCASSTTIANRYL